MTSVKQEKQHPSHRRTPGTKHRTTSKWEESEETGRSGRSQRRRGAVGGVRGDGVQWEESVESEETWHSGSGRSPRIVGGVRGEWEELDETRHSGGGRSPKIVGGVRGDDHAPRLPTASSGVAEITSSWPPPPLGCWTPARSPWRRGYCCYNMTGVLMRLKNKAPPEPILQSRRQLTVGGRGL